MTPVRFDTFFQTATGHPPYDYQRRLACGERQGRPEAEWLAGGHDCASKLISIPTGLGKTAGVVIAWLWNRVHLQSQEWPRRLVYCLPMRTLVEQTEKEVRKWLQAHGQLGNGKPHKRDGTIGVHVLMGGEDAGEWDLYPEREAVLIGTQDMLLSRALNRGYGMSRYRWPMHFGLLNNDCLWVMDETQLMGVSVETSAQLDGFRHNAPNWVFGKCPTWWMSATLDETRLSTVDHPRPTAGWSREELHAAEQSGGRAAEFFGALKRVNRCELSLSPRTKVDYASSLATLVAERHRSLCRSPHGAGTLTLVVVNRVSRAQEIFSALTTDRKEGRAKLPPLYDPSRVGLVHSRFRLCDRQRHERLLFGEGDRIVVATQAVEAGVDISARLLISELAPWSALVQRFGRCNRRAEYADAEILWVDIDPDSTDEFLRPYGHLELDRARAAISKLCDASPRTLAGVIVPEVIVVRPVIRRRDLVDLFDTTPDICGRDLDISRYIRDCRDSDVQFFWRDIETTSPASNEPGPGREELCRVSIGDATKFLAKKTTHAWLWNPLQAEWQPVPKPRPGGVYLIAAGSGGYDDVRGWVGQARTKELTPSRPLATNREIHDDDNGTFSRFWQTLADHTHQVVSACDVLAASLVPEWTSVLRVAALWHDLGKAHGAFQAMLRNGDVTRESTIWAKSPHNAGKCARRGFRHELASALAWLLQGPTGTANRDLVAYLIAAHHGKVRLSVRALPDEQGDPEDPERLFARGIWHGDVLPWIQFDGLSLPETTLDLAFMRMGEGPYGPSWLARTTALRDEFGPFRLAYLEALLRAADARASAVELKSNP